MLRTGRQPTAAGSALMSLTSSPLRLSSGWTTPDRLKPLPIPVRLEETEDWLVSGCAPSCLAPAPAGRAYRLSCLPASPIRRLTFPRGFFRALPSPVSSFPLSCGGGLTVRTSCPSRFLSPTVLLPCSPAAPQTVGGCHLSPQRSGRCECPGAHALPRVPGTGKTEVCWEGLRSVSEHSRARCSFIPS